MFTSWNETRKILPADRLLVVGVRSSLARAGAPYLATAFFQFRGGSFFLITTAGWLSNYDTGGGPAQKHPLPPADWPDFWLPIFPGGADE